MEKLSYILPPRTSLELLATEYLRESNISNFICHLLIVTGSLDALKKSSNRKEMRVKKEKVQVLQQTTVERRQKIKDQDDEILGFDLYLMVRITLTLLFSKSQF